MSRISRLSLLSLAAALGVALAACGQKGDLYLPDAAREAVPAATTSPPAGGPAGAPAAADDDDDDQNAGAPGTR